MKVNKDYYKQAVWEAIAVCPAPASWPLTFWP